MVQIIRQEIFGTWLQVNYSKPLLYPVSVRNFPSPERGVFCILIVDIISKRSQVLFSLLCVRNYHYKRGLLKLSSLSEKYTQRIIDYCRSTVKIVTASNQFFYYFYFCEIEQEKVHFLIFSIDLR